jgi:hypothetical protein
MRALPAKAKSKRPSKLRRIVPVIRPPLTNQQKRRVCPSTVPAVQDRTEPRKARWRDVDQSLDISCDENSICWKENRNCCEGRSLSGRAVANLIVCRYLPRLKHSWRLDRVYHNTLSSIIFHTEASQVLVATDTLATSPDGKPLKFTTKAFVVPHLRMIIAGTGAGGFLDTWFMQINTSMVVRGIQNLNHHAPHSLAVIWSGYKQQFPLLKDFTATVYHFGFCEESTLIQSFAYRSDRGFASELLPYGLAVKPQCDVPENYRVPDDIKGMMVHQRSVQKLRPKNERVHIGGEIQIHHLSKTGFSIYTLDRFDDFGSVERAMFSSFRRM